MSEDRELLAAEIADRLEDLLSGNDQFHPVGCSEWEDRARVAIDMAKDFILSRPPTPAPEYGEQEVNAEALRLFEQRWGDVKLWNGRRTNRAYYRRLARGSLARAALSGRVKP